VNTKRLYRCREDRQIAGVAGGIAEYLEVDPTVVRILWILSVFLGGFTLLLYIIMAFIVPLEPVGYGYGAPVQPWPGTPQAPSAGGGGATAADDLTGVADGASDVGDGAQGGAGSAPAGPAPAAPAAAAVAPLASWHVQRVHAQAGERRERGGGATMVFGVLLVIFGGIALLGPMFPGWIAGVHLGPAFLLALGIALVVASIRRPATDR